MTTPLTPLEDPHVKKHVEQVKENVLKALKGMEFSKFEAIKGYAVAKRDGGEDFVAEIDIGEGTNKFLHVKYTIVTGTQHSQKKASFASVGLYYRQNANIPPEVSYFKDL